MQNSPSRGYELISETISLINQGFRPQRCQISRGIITYHDPDVQSLNHAIKSFQAKPSEAGFTAIVGVVKKCEAKEVASFAYDHINALIEQINEIAAEADKKPKNKFK